MTDDNKVLSNELKIDMEILSQVDDLDRPLEPEEEQQIGSHQKENLIPQSEHLEAEDTEMRPKRSRSFNPEIADPPFESDKIARRIRFSRDNHDRSEFLKTISEIVHFNRDWPKKILQFQGDWASKIL
jgi:hypothetical protein